jgi:hypothetical protein
MKDVIGEGSSHEYVRGAAQSVLDKRDLSLPAPATTVLEKAAELDALSFFMGDRATVIQVSPTFTTDFRTAFTGTLNQLIEGKSEKLQEVVGTDQVISGLDIVRAYEQSVETVATSVSKQFRTGMLIPQVYGRVLDHFGIPMSLETIEELKANHPEVAENLLKQRDQWRNPDTSTQQSGDVEV